MNTPSPEPVIHRALLSVSDKTGLVEFARFLEGCGVELVSTGGTAKTLAAAGITVRDVADLTGFPEMMDGRVKTLHPAVHGGLLGLRDDPAHCQALQSHGLQWIDLLVVNLYPFEDTVKKGAEFADCIENIDIGGPAMLRAAAKNFRFVTVVTDVVDYGRIQEEMQQHGGATSLKLRQELAQKTYARTATYDAAISNWLADQQNPTTPPAYRAFGGSLIQPLRYGENPHQAAAFYRTGKARAGVASARQLQGKELSYNNINDTDAAYECVAEFAPDATAAVVIVKHANPCGVAQGEDLRQAYLKALACDPVSAFGGIIACNRTLDRDAAEEMIKIFTEVIIAPDATPDAIELIAGKKNLRLLLAGSLPDPRQAGLKFRSVAGGMLVQGRDNLSADDLELKTVTRRQPTAQQLEDLRFAFRVAKHVKSNAIVYARDGATVGIGAGQMSRVDSARIAALKAQDAAREAGHTEPLTQGCVAASDAFFPFADGLQKIIEAGATAVIQPGGSMRDDEVIRAADDAGIAMVLTGVRHFQH